MFLRLYVFVGLLECFLCLYVFECKCLYVFWFLRQHDCTFCIFELVCFIYLCFVVCSFYCMILCLHVSLFSFLYVCMFFLIECLMFVCFRVFFSFFFYVSMFLYLHLCIIFVFTCMYIFVLYIFVLCENMFLRVYVFL